ncbi:MAG: peroxiredoxin-like family protein [Wenzhouxiangellaceae bacterium]|nr:peroxiredoxin-like family protein [Wenzhouxiangellaceae bacterium]
MRRLIAAFLLIAISQNPAFAEIYDQAEQVRPILPGMQVPSFKVADVEGLVTEVGPDAIEKPIVLTFYRGGWCPYCNMHLAELRKAEAELEAMGFEVWFISPDQPELLAEGDDSEYGYELLSDPGMNAAEAFGIAFRVDEETYQRYVGFGMDLNERSGDDHRALPAPATFIIGSDGIVQFSYVNPDYTVRLAPEVLLAAAQSYADQKHRRFKRGD